MSLIAEAIARTLRLNADLALRTFADPPEAVHETPTAVVLETSARAERKGFQGLWEASTETRVWVLIETRRDAETNIHEARPWEFTLLALFAQNDTYLDDTGTPFGEITAIKTRMGDLPYGKLNFVGIEITLTARVDVQVAARCG